MIWVYFRRLLQTVHDS